MPAGDLTESGERGTNLSGGQKARISLARAVYANKDCILLDDPLSALDARVKKRIFKLVLMRKLADKTRVLVTHEVDFLHLADSIVCLKDGQIEFQGTYEEVKANPYLTEIVKIQHAHRVERQASLNSNAVRAPSQVITAVNDFDDDDDDDGGLIKNVDLNEIPSDSSDGENDRDLDQSIEEENDLGFVKNRTFSVNLGNLTED